MIRGVIFDADGTLLDSMGFWEQTVYDMIEMSGVKEPEPGLIETLTPMSMIEGAHYMKERYGLKIPIEQLIDEENRRVLEFYTTRCTLRAGIKELVQTLSLLAIPMAVATATERGLIEKALVHAGISEHVGGVVSCSDVGKGKDFPDVFLKAAQLIGAAPGSIIVADDSPTAVETARKAGFVTVAVTDDGTECERILGMIK